MNNIITPCFILDSDDLMSSIFGFKKALKENFKTYILGYSVKTNSLPFLMGLVKSQGMYAEVVSYDEYNLAKYCGFQPDRIIYNGPMKSKETFVEAMEGGSIINIETWKEIEWIESVNSDKKYSVGIRVNVDLSKISADDAKDDDEFSRFGFCVENGELEKAIDKIKQYPNLIVNGLHIHRTSKTRSVNVYRQLISWIGTVVKSLDLKLDYLDIGGGYYGIMEGKPTYSDYMSAVREELLPNFDLDNLTIIVEPGNAIVASCFSYLSAVVDVKKIPQGIVLTTDGTRNDIDPTYHKTDYFKEFIYKNLDKPRIKIERQIVAGCTCLEFDKLFELKDCNQLEVGDQILYKSLGAYTMCLSPLFIRYIPNIYLREKEIYTLVRDKWTEKEYVMNSKLKD